MSSFYAHLRVLVDSEEPSRIEDFLTALGHHDVSTLANLTAVSAGPPVEQLIAPGFFWNLTQGRFQGVVWAAFESQPELYDETEPALHELARVLLDLGACDGVLVATFSGGPAAYDVFRLDAEGFARVHTSGQDVEADRRVEAVTAGADDDLEAIAELFLRPDAPQRPSVPLGLEAYIQFLTELASTAPPKVGVERGTLSWYMFDYLQRQHAEHLSRLDKGQREAVDDLLEMVFQLAVEECFRVMEKQGLGLQHRGTALEYRQHPGASYGSPERYPLRGPKDDWSNAVDILRDD